MKRGITFKFFIITSVFFIIFISGSLLFQSLYFNKFYIGKKMHSFEDNFRVLKDDYGKDALNDRKKITNFEESNNSKIAILDTTTGNLSFVDENNGQKRSSNSINVIRQTIYKWLSDTPSNAAVQQGQTVTYIADNKEYNIKNIVCVSMITSSDNKKQVLFAVTSLQPVDEATSVLKEFYIYLFAGAIVLIVIMSTIYSRMITKPLVRLNRVADNMAQLDFSEQCIVESDDEIGRLAKTLNFLSQNLDYALRSLRESNDRLREDIEKEKRLEKMRKEFVAGVSHELKTPISLIEGYAEGIKDDIVQGEDREYYLDVIIDESHKMGNLVTDMLDLSQLESGNFKLKQTEFELDKLVVATSKKYLNLIQEKNIKMEVRIKEGIKVFADKNRIEQVITNFLTNAIRYGSENGNIKVAMVNQGPNIVIEVENDGENIPEESKEKLWNKFYKIDKSRNRSLGGTGLGLAIVKNILMLHESEFGVTNTETGVKFYFSLKKV